MAAHDSDKLPNPRILTMEPSRALAWQYAQTSRCSPVGAWLSKASAVARSAGTSNSIASSEVVTSKGVSKVANMPKTDRRRRVRGA